MRYLCRMGRGLLGLALVAPPVAWADPLSPSTPPEAPASPRLSFFQKEQLCAKCQRAALQARGINVPPAPDLPKEGMVATDEKCERCGAAVMMMSPVTSASSAPPYSSPPVESWSPAVPSSPAPPPASAPAPAPARAPAFTRVELSPAPPPPAMGSTPPLVPGPSSAPAWASNPGTTTPLVVASMPAQAASPASDRPPAGPAAPRGGLLARARALSPLPPRVLATLEPGQVCAMCAASGALVMNPNDQPGRAVAGGTGPVPSAEPTPIGVIQERYAYQYQGPGMGEPGVAVAGGRPGGSPGRRGPGSSDPSVMPTSFATEPYDPVGHNRPHILTHLFGLDAIGKRSHDARERRAREKHASIRYDPLNERRVDDLPAKLVYGK